MGGKVEGRGREREREDEVSWVNVEGDVGG